MRQEGVLGDWIDEVDFSFLTFLSKYCIFQILLQMFFTVLSLFIAVGLGFLVS